WHGAGVAAPTAPTGLPQEGVTALHRAGAPGATTDEDGHLVYHAPEGTWQASANDRFRLDVFGLGALAYYVLTDGHPAPGAAALRDRLRQQGGLDISPELPEASEALRHVVLSATRPSPSERTPDLAVFLEQLSQAEAGLEQSGAPDVDPLEARPGDLLAGR